MRVLILPALIFTAGCALQATVSAQNPSQNLDAPPTWLNIAKPQAASETESVDVDTRGARSRQFDSPAPQRTQLADLSAATGVSSVSAGVITGGARSFLPPRPLPVETSDYVATGSVVTNQPYLSSDKTKVYTELLFKPDTVLKNVHDASPGNTPVTILQEGGSMRLPSGRIVSSAQIGGANPVRLSTRYLLFLKYSSLTRAYTVARVWDLTGKQPQQLDYDGHPIPQGSTATGVEASSEDDLISSVREKIAAQQ